MQIRLKCQAEERGARVQFSWQELTDTKRDKEKKAVLAHPAIRERPGETKIGLA